MSRGRNPAWLIGLLAIAVRVGVVLAQHEQLLNDSADYHRLAVSLVSGHGFGMTHFAPGGGPTALRPPLYPLTIAAVYEVVGVHVIAARLFAAILGGAVVVLLIELSTLVYTRTVALVGGLLAAVYPPLILAGTTMMSESIALPLELGSLLCCMYYRRSRKLLWALGAGGLLGLSLLTRPNLAVLSVPLAGLMWGGGRRAWGMAVGVLLLSAAVVTLPWLVRDRVVMHHWIPITTQNGYVLAGTYNPTSASDRLYRAAWRPANLDPGVAHLISTHPQAGEVQLDGLLQSFADRYVRSHPGYVAQVFSYNSGRLFGLASLDFARQATYSEYGYGSAWGVAEDVAGLAALALAAAALTVQQARRAPLFYTAAPVVLWVSIVLFQAVPRFRAEIDPFLLQLAAVTLVTGARRLRPSAPPISPR